MSMLPRLLTIEGKREKSRRKCQSCSLSKVYFSWLQSFSGKHTVMNPKSTQTGFGLHSQEKFPNDIKSIFLKTQLI